MSDPHSQKQPMTLVTAALPYPNGPLHLGHVAGVHLPGDIYSRFLKMMDRPVVTVCGTDDHGVGIELAAKAAGMSEDDLVIRNRQMIIDSLDKIGIRYDIFSRTHSKTHFDTSTGFFLRLLEKGYIEPRDEEMAHCEDCGRFLPDRYIEGVCPHCKNPGARGDQCEKCGKLLNPMELLDPVCKICGSSNIKTKKTVSYFFLLSKFQDQIREWIDTKTSWKPNVLGTARKWLNEGLEDRAISRDIRWGIPIPGEEEKKMYVWFEAPIGYVSFLKELAEQMGDMDLFENTWKGEGSRIVHFIGKDNIVFHTVIWPAILMASGDYNLPTDVPGNEFLNLEGQKLSTSRNHAVWLHDIAEHYNPDSIRYYLTYCIPEKKDSNFSWQEFQEKNNELANDLGNLINRVLTFSTSNFGGIVDEVVELDASGEAIFDLVGQKTQEAIGFLEKYRFRESLTAIFTLITALNRYFNETAPWVSIKTDREKAKRSVDILASCIIDVAILLKPFLPETTTKILDAFSISSDDLCGYSSIRNHQLAYPLNVKKIDILFKKIDDETVEAERAKIGM